jgi:predicted nucleic acid-binding protein
MPLPLLGPHVLVVDTMVLYDDIVRRLRHNQARTALVESVNRRATRLFAASHVYEEMYDHIGGFDRRSVERREVLRVFEEVYLRVCRFVYTPRRELHRRVLPVAEVDASDVPTAELALLLAPCDVLTRDSHLLDAGFGTGNWLARVFEAEELLGVEGATLAMMLLTGEASKHLVEAVQGAVSPVVDLLWRSEPARLVVAGISGALLAYLSMLDPEVITRLLRQGAVGIGKAGLVSAQIAAEPARRRTVLHSTSVQPNIPASTVERVARLLVPEPLATEQIAMRLGLPTDTVRGTLELHPSFVNSGGSWGVGSLRAPRETTRQLTPRTGADRSATGTD